MTETAAPELIGLVLAGGRSLRMGRDKGGILFRGSSLVERALEALRPHVTSVLVSVRQGQADYEPYVSLPLVYDDAGVAGPAAGLLAAWALHPAAALLVLAVDMPLVDASTLGYLRASRALERAATAYRHTDGTPEPLCAIWEPRIAPALRRAETVPGATARAANDRDVAQAAPSLRAILEASDVAWLDPPDPALLMSLNTPTTLAVAESQESDLTS